MDTIDKINFYLAKSGKTGADLSRALGLSNSIYSQWNTKKTKPRKSKLPVIADFLGVTVEDLLPDEEYSNLLELTAKDNNMQSALDYLRKEKERRAERAAIQGFLPVGIRIKEGRESAHYSQRSLAERCGITEAELKRYEQGVEKVPEHVLKAIADELLVDEEYLRDKKENSPSPKAETERSYVDVATKRIWSPAPVSILVAQYNVPAAVLADIAACSIREAEQLALGTTFGTDDQLSRVAAVFAVALDDLTRGWVPLYANPAVLADIARRTLDRFPTLANR